MTYWRGRAAFGDYEFRTGIKRVRPRIKVKRNLA